MTQRDPQGLEWFDHVVDLFAKAIGDPAALRDIDGFVATHAGDDEELAAELGSMLRAHVDEERRDDTRTLDAHNDAIVRFATEQASEQFEDELPTAIGPFRIVRLIASGGMGTVYEAQQEEPERRVALKVVRADQASPETMTRFHLEGNLLARLSHPGIAKIYAMGRAAMPTGVVPYIVMEYIEGQPITEYVRSQDLSLDARVALLDRVADALSHAHESAILHRDIKPSNILVDAGGDPRLLDFGIARHLDENATRRGLTSSGVFLGTLNYMSPEQARGDGSLLDVRADLYGLAAVGYELIAGHPPHDFQGTALHEATARLLSRPVPELRRVAPSVPIDLSAIFARALSIEPDRRYVNVRQFSGDLRRYLTDETVSARPPSRVYRARKFLRRHRVPALLGAATFLSLVVGLIVALGQRDRAEDALEESQRLRFEAEARRNAAVSQQVMAAIQSGDFLRAIALAETDGPLAADAPIEARYVDAQIHAFDDFIDLPFPDTYRWSAMSFDGRFIAGLQAPRRIHVWTREGGVAHVDLPEAHPPVRAVSFVGHPVPRIAAEHEGERVTLLDPTTGSVIRHVRLDADAEPVDPPWLAYSREGRIWDLRSGRPMSLDQAGWSHVRAFGRGIIHRRDAPPGGLRVIDQETGEIGGVPATAQFMSPSPDARWYIVGNRDVDLWDARQGIVVRRVPRRTDRHLELGAFDASGRRFVLRANGVLEFYDVAGQSLGHQVDRRAMGLAESLGWHDDDLVASFGGWDQRKELRLLRHLAHFDTGPDAPEVLRHGTGEQRHDYVYAVCWHPEGRWLASAAWDGRTLVWDTWTGRMVRELDGGPIATDHVPPVSLAWSPDGFRLVCQRRGLTTVWDVWHGTIASRGAVPDRVIGVSNAGRVLVDRAGRVAEATVDPDGEQSRPEDDRPVTPPPWAADSTRHAIETVGFATAGGHVAAPGEAAFAFETADRGFTVWENGAREPTWFQPRPTAVLSVALVDGGRRLLAGLRGGQIEIWDVAHRTLVGILQHGPSYVIAMRISPDGRTLASGSGDGTVRLWGLQRRSHRQARVREAAAQAMRLRPRVQGHLATGRSMAKAADRVRTDPHIAAADRTAALALLSDDAR